MATMRFVLNIVLIFTIVQLAKSEKCPKTIRHYYELGCTPVYLEANDTCPIRFDCSSAFNDNRDRIHHCYHKSKAYVDGEKLLEKDIDSTCSKDCVCMTFDGKKAPKIMCDTRICPEKDTHFDRHELGSCYAANVVCNQEDQNAAECHYNKTAYREGEIILIDDGCMYCICDKGFNGTLESLQCSRTPCDTDWHIHRVAKKGCAPIYSYDFDCCPTSWKCPNHDPYEIVHTNQTIRSEDPNMKCKFGDDLLDVGDEVTNKYDECLCKVPPLVTCGPD